jgi:hypothetical protein
MSRQRCVNRTKVDGRANVICPTRAWFNHGQSKSNNIYENSQEKIIKAVYVELTLIDGFK